MQCRFVQEYNNRRENSFRFLKFVILIGTSKREMFHFEHDGGSYLLWVIYSEKLRNILQNASLMFNLNYLSTCLQNKVTERPKWSSNSVMWWTSCIAFFAACYVSIVWSEAKWNMESEQPHGLLLAYECIFKFSF